MAANQHKSPKGAGCRNTRKPGDDRISGQTKEKAIIQDCVNSMYNQFVVDPNTKEPKRMLDYPSRELVTKLVTFSYMTQYNWVLLKGPFQISSFNVSISIRKFCNVRMQLPSEYEKIKVVTKSSFVLRYRSL